MEVWFVIEEIQLGWSTRLKEIDDSFDLGVAVWQMGQSTSRVAIRFLTVYKGAKCNRA